MSITTEHTEEHHTFIAEAQNRQRLLTSISRCCDTAKVKHTGTREEAVLAIIARLKADGIEFRFTDRGWVVAEKNGSTCNLQTLVEQVLLTDPTIGDRDSVAEQVRAGALNVEAKSDLRTAKEKSDFITRFGLAAWQNLPNLREVAINLDPATMSAKDYARLT